MKNNRVILIGALISAVLLFEVWVILTRPKIAVKNEAINNLKSAGSESLGAGISGSEFLSALVPIEGGMRNDKEVAQKSDLKLELVGTAIGNIKDPIAFIKDLETGSQGIYKISDKLKGGRVIRIAKGEVDLEIDGSTQTLRLRKNGSDYAAANKSAMITMDGDSIVMKRDALLNETAAIMGSVRLMKIRPYCESAKVVGMKIEGVDENSLIAQAGIRDKDVVTSVNNQKIDSYQKALQVFNKVRNQSEIKVSLLRDGQTKNLNYRFEN